MYKTLQLSFFSLLLLTASCRNSSLDKANKHPSNSEKTNDFLLTKSPFGIELIEAYVPFVSKAFKANGQFNFSYEINMLNTHYKACYWFSF